MSISPIDLGAGLSRLVRQPEQVPLRFAVKSIKPIRPALSHYLPDPPGFEVLISPYIDKDTNSFGCHCY